MKLSTTTLHRYLDAPVSTDQLVVALENSGIEVEDVQRATKLNTKIIVGLTTNVVQHPNADKLRVTLVDVGAPKPLHIVCGAPNLANGQIVAVAAVGSTLPDGTVITEAKLRGETSQGMLCSEAELGMSDDHAGILVLPEDYQVGKSLCDLLPADDIVDIKSAANRFDLLNYEGIVREVAAQLGVKSKLANYPKLEIMGDSKLIRKIHKLAPAYSATILELPAKLKELSTTEQLAIAAAGMRPISPIVDASNLTMLTVGQPTHAFDADKLALPLEVRLAEKDETLTTLDGVARKLSPDDLVIADARGPVALAGVMGGQDSEVTADTKRILLEVATFDAATIRKTAKRHNLRSESSARYERGLPVQLVEHGREAAVSLLSRLGLKPVSGNRLGEVSGGTRRLKIDPVFIGTLLGVDVDGKTIRDCLAKLGIAATAGAKLSVEVPWWRPDIATPADIAEEVIKVMGLDALPATIPAWHPAAIRPNLRREQIGKLRGLLQAAGLFEITTYSFTSAEQLEQFGLKPEKHLKLKNPMSVEQAYMRTTLLPSIAEVLVRNQRYATSFGVSEISRVFIPAAKKGDLPQEPLHLAVGVVGDYFAAKAPIDLIARELNLNLRFKPTKNGNYFPGRVANMVLNNQTVGTVGELHPKHTSKLKGKKTLSYLEVDVDTLLSAAGEHEYKPLSRFPSISRDIAVVVEQKVQWDTLAEAVRKAAPDVALQFNSVYDGEGIPAGRKSIAFNITMSSLERTLTDKEADQTVETILAALQKSIGATPRS